MTRSRPTSVFRGLIQEAARNPHFVDSILADPHDVCRYPELAKYIHDIQTYLSDSGVETGDCLAVELSNTVRGALLVLAILDAGYSFLALPISGQGARAGGAKAAQVEYPSFAKKILSVRNEKTSVPPSLGEPSSFIAIADNPQHQATSERQFDGDSKLYFRTSGSLGTPKLATHRYSGLHTDAVAVCKARGFGPHHRLALPTPIFHMYGLGAGLLAAIAGGTSVDLQASSNILIFFDRESKFNPNVAYVTPPFCESLIRARKNPRKYEFMVTSGDRISPSAFKRSEELHGTMISQYGSTEMGAVAAGTVDMPYETRSATSGKLIDGVQVRIVKIPDSPDADCGELQIHRARGFDGYVDLAGDELIPENAYDGEWYRTGDLAKMTDDGMLVVLGRGDLSVNRSGVLLPLADVESRLRDIPDIEEAAVTLGADTIRGREMIAFCKCIDRSDASPTDLLGEYAKTSQPYAIPDRLEILSSLPKLPNGKIDRQALSRLAHGAEKDVTADVAD